MLVAGTTAFAAALYARAAREPENIFFSPASVSVALTMTYAGARGETSTEMGRALQLPAFDPARLHATVGALAAALGSAPGVELAIANALFGQAGYGFLPEFLAVLAAHYGAGLREVDFVGATERARLTINEWVEQQTKDKIVDLVPDGVLNALTRLVLVNAIYFKGRWASLFRERSTIDQPFFRADGQSSPVALMHQKGLYKLVTVDGAQMLELPYEGGAISMVAILPQRKDGLSDIEAKLTSNLGAWLQRIGRARPETVDVYLPRFRVEATLRLDDALKALGMPLAFEKAEADFSGMIGRRDLSIAAVLHKAFVEVNEQGTVAAAATAVVLASRSAPRPTPVFRADHPFVFLIRDTRTGCVLFLGRLLDPRR